MELPLLRKQMVEEFQCPGCSAGLNTSSGCFEPDDASLACANHSAGTYISGIGNVNLGLPRGFNRLGPIGKNLQRSNIRLFERMPNYDIFNVLVWVQSHTVDEGDHKRNYLLVRTYIPRTNVTFVDVIADATVEDLPERFRNSVFDVTAETMD